MAGVWSSDAVARRSLVGQRHRKGRPVLLKSRRHGTVGIDRMADDGSTPPLPRRAPGDSGLGGAGTDEIRPAAEACGTAHTRIARRIGKADPAAGPGGPGRTAGREPPGPSRAAGPGRTTCPGPRDLRRSAGPGPGGGSSRTSRARAGRHTTGPVTAGLAATAAAAADPPASHRNQRGDRGGGAGRAAGTDAEPARHGGDGQRWPGQRRRGAADPLSASVIIATPAVRGLLGRSYLGRCAPAAVAGFGSGNAGISVRVIAPRGARSGC
jgi:hypothetical protein